MPMMEKPIVFDPAQFDHRGQIQPNVLLTAFQNIATDHVDAHHLGMADLIRQNLLWVVIQTKYIVKAQLIPNETYRLSTWSLEPRHGMVQREYSIVDGEGNVRIIGVSRWMLMDMNTRKATLKMNEVLSEIPYGDASNFGKHFRLLRAFPKSGSPRIIMPDPSAIDFNDHVNNSYYAAYAMAQMPANRGTISEFIIDYRKELRLGDALVLYTKDAPDHFEVEGFLEDNTELVFICKMTYAG